MCRAKAITDSLSRQFLTLVEFFDEIEHFLISIIASSLHAERSISLAINSMPQVQRMMAQSLRLYYVVRQEITNSLWQ